MSGTNNPKTKGRVVNEIINPERSIHIICYGFAGILGVKKLFRILPDPFPPGLSSSSGGQPAMLLPASCAQKAQPWLFQAGGCVRYHRYCI